MKPAIGSAILFSLLLVIQPSLSLARGGGGGGGGHGGGGHGGGDHASGGGHGGHEHGHGHHEHGFQSDGGDDGDSDTYGYEESDGTPACGGQPAVQLFYDSSGNVYAAQCPNGAVQYFEYYTPNDFSND